MKVVIIGGGWAGCAAAIQGIKSGAEVYLYERTDLLLGVGNVGGIMRNNGRYTASEELINLGAPELMDIMDSIALHKDMEFPGHKHAWLCDVSKAEPLVRTFLLNKGVNISFRSRIINVEKKDNKIEALILDDKSKVYGDVFIDTTGSTGSMTNCMKYGNGCSMCVLRCPSFGIRVSVSEKAGVKDLAGERENGSKGAMSGSCEIPREGISPELLKILDEKGVVVLPTPKEDIHFEKLEEKVCQQYALKEFAENIILLDTGHIKLMTSYYPIDKLRKVKGLEQVRYIDPLAGSIGNSIRYLAAAPRTNTMKVKGVDNLYCAGEKSGFFVGHTEAMVTGTLAGYNAIKYIKGEEELELSRSLASGDIIAYANDKVEEGNLKERYTFSGSDYFERMKDIGLYTTNKEEIKNRVKLTGLYNIFK